MPQLGHYMTNQLLLEVFVLHLRIGNKTPNQLLQGMEYN